MKKELEKRPTYIELWKSAMSLFLEKLPNDKLIIKYLEEKKLQNFHTAYDAMMDFIGEHYKPELWFTTNLAILESVESMIEEGYGNQNILREEISDEE